MSRRTRLKLVSIDGDHAAPAEAPAVEPVVRVAANDSEPATPGWGPEPADSPALVVRPEPRRWRSLSSLSLSLVAHAGLIAVAAATLTRPGSEASTEAVAVEIVFEAPKAPAEPVVAEVPDFVVPHDALIDAILSEAPAIDLAETVEPNEVVEPEAEPDAPVPIAEQAVIAPASEAEVDVPTPDASTEALLAEPPAFETAEADEPSGEIAAAVEDGEPVEPAKAAPAEAETPVDPAPLPEPMEPQPAGGTEPAQITDAALATGPAPGTEPAQPATPVGQTEPSIVTLPPPDPALAVLSAPPTIVEADRVAPAPAIAAPVAAPPPAPEQLAVEPSPDMALAPEAALPESIVALPSPRPINTSPAAKAKSDATSRKPAPRAKSEAPKQKAEQRAALRKKPEKAAPKPVPAASASKTEAKRPAKTQAGSGASGAAAASPGAEAAYGRKLLAHIERRKRYPAAARAANATGSVRLSISIDRNGQLRGARVTGGSGHKILDEEALATARRAAPYPAPPDSVGGKSYSFSVTLRFSK